MANPAVTKSEIFFEACVASLAAVFSQITTETWTPIPAGTIESFAPRAVLRVKLGQSLRGCFWWSVQAEDAALMLELFTGEKAQVLESLEAMQAEALIELTRQWARLTATRLKPTFGELSVEATAESELPTDLPAARLLRIASGDRSLGVRVEVDAELLASFDEGHESCTPPPQEPAPAGPERPIYGNNLELVLGVELGVRLRFGSCRASLREVLELSPEAVLELNREIHEPVDLMLNDRVVTRGDIVVVDGNYGLRVVENAFAELRTGAR